MAFSERLAARSPFLAPFALASLALAAAGASAWGFTLVGGSALLGFGTDVVKVYYSMTDCPISEAEMTAAIDAAARAWSSVPTSRLTLQRGGPVPTTLTEARNGTSATVPLNPVIVCDPNPNLSGVVTDSNYIPAYTVSKTTGVVLDYSYVVLNAESNKEANVGELDATVLAVVLAHEIGHALGLGHSSNTNALMYYDASSKAEVKLAQDDMDGITYLYPRDEPGGGTPFGCAGAVAGERRAQSNRGGVR